MNVIDFPTADTLTPEQLLAEVGKMNLDQVMVVAYDADGKVVVRTSRLTRRDALWLAEQARLHALGV